MNIWCEWWLVWQYPIIHVNVVFVSRNLRPGSGWWQTLPGLALGLSPQISTNQRPTFPRSDQSEATWSQVLVRPGSQGCYFHWHLLPPYFELGWGREQLCGKHQQPTTAAWQQRRQSSYDNHNKIESEKKWNSESVIIVWGKKRTKDDAQGISTKASDIA